MRSCLNCSVFSPLPLHRGNTKSSNHQSSSSSSSSSLSSCSSSSALAQELAQQASALPESETNNQVDWTYDPNEPRYCICNQVHTHPETLSHTGQHTPTADRLTKMASLLLKVSYGEMVGCDNQDVSTHFHLGVLFSCSTAVTTLLSHRTLSNER